MSRARAITRRTLLGATAAGAGGAAFGAWWIARDPPNPLAPGEGAHALNPFVVVDGEGVTIVAPRAEMGQGTHTTLAALVAEEMDLDWDGLRVIHGPPARAYWNGALMGLGLPYPEYARTEFQGRLALGMALVAKGVGIQATGGSTSTMDAFERMRAAGALARETLLVAAARRLDLPPEDLRTERGSVVSPDGTAIPYTDLAGDLAGVDPPSRVALRDPSEWRLLGRPLPRTDMVAKSTGTATYGIDVRLPGMLHAAPRLSPRLGGAMRGFDPAPALAMPGVEAVVDLGQGIAVVATNTWTAMRAAEAVEVEWAPAPYPDTTDEMAELVEAALDGPRDSRLRDEGDVDTLGAPTLEALYAVPWLAHATMEPVNATALVTGGAAEIWCGNQSPTLIRDHVAAALDLSGDAVTVHTPFLGGGFGRRGEVDFAVVAARVAAALPGRPVKTTWSREHDMTHDFFRPLARARMRGWVEGGAVAGLHAALAAPSVTRASARRLVGMAPPGSDKGHVEGAFDQPYGLPHWRVDGHLADLAVPVGFWRSVGNSQNAFFHECFLDELAHAAGRDPLALRVELARAEHEPSARVIEAAADLAGWTGETLEGVGRGVAFTFSFGTPVAEIVEVREEHGRIHVADVWIACDVGPALDPSIVEAQMSGGAIFGLSAAMLGEITFQDGEVQERNFPDYDALRMTGAPRTHVRIVRNRDHMGGAGEPGVPPAAPALANALFDLTGKRVRRLPLRHGFDFVT